MKKSKNNKEVSKTSKHEGNMVKRFASLKLAILIILSLAICIATGTIVEAQYDAETAAHWVYRSGWMYGIMGALALNLIAVMVDRWPWKVRHTGFVCAHIGILFLLAGSLITQKYGVDGSMRIELGAKERQVSVSDRELTLYSSTADSNSWRKEKIQPIEILDQPPTEENPVEWQLEQGAKVKVDRVMPYATASERIGAAAESETTGSAIRLQIYNDRVNQNFWLLQKNHETTESLAMGPAQFHLTADLPIKGSDRNEVYFRVEKNSLHYAVFYREPSRKPLKGSAQEADEFDTGWMGLKVRVLRVLPIAKRTWDIHLEPRPTAVTTSAVHVIFTPPKGVPVESWVQLEDVAKFLVLPKSYVLKYGHRLIDVGFDMHLKDFTIGRYQGTRQAMSYESEVELSDSVPGSTQKISMNEPLKKAGYTFYQSSFQEDPATGNPIASILSVNRDPGRWIKYLGCIIMISGIIHLFWFRRKQNAKA